MNITKESTGDLTALLRIKIEKEDYDDRVTNELKKYRQKAEIKGFRKGMVPLGIVKKLYGTAVLAEELNKIVSENLSKYLIEENLNILGEPIPNESEQQKIDWDNQEEFEFVFDLGLSPEFDLEPGENDKIKYYPIAVDDKMIDEQIDHYAQSAGDFHEAEIVSDESMIKGMIEELDKEGNELADGIKVTEASIFPRVIKDEEIKKEFIGANLNQILTVDLKKAFPSDTELAGMLKIDKEKVSDISDKFQITITSISDYKASEVNQQLFDKIFGEGNINSEEEFRSKVKELISENLTYESNYKFNIDAKDYLIENIKFDLPDEFLKNWLVQVNKELTKEKVDSDWQNFEKDLKWQLIKSKLAKKYDVNVSEDEILDEAKIATRQQLQQYGMSNMPDQQVEVFAKQLLEKDEQRNQLEEKKYEDKIMAELLNKVTLDKEEVTIEEFKDLVNPEPKVKTEELKTE